MLKEHGITDIFNQFDVLLFWLYVPKTGTV